MPKTFFWNNPLCSDLGLFSLIGEKTAMLQGSQFCSAYSFQSQSARFAPTFSQRGAKKRFRIGSKAKLQIFIVGELILMAFSW